MLDSTSAMLRLLGTNQTANATANVDPEAGWLNPLAFGIGSITGAAVLFFLIVIMLAKCRTCCIRSKQKCITPTATLEEKAYGQQSLVIQITAPKQRL